MVFLNNLGQIEMVISIRPRRETAASKRAANNKQTQRKNYAQMTLKELADYWAKRFEGPDWETVDKLYSAIHQMVGMDCELAAKTDPSHLVMAALTVVTFWCDYLAQQQAALEKNIAPAAEHIGV